MLSRLLEKNSQSKKKMKKIKSIFSTKSFIDSLDESKCGSRTVANFFFLQKSHNLLFNICKLVIFFLGDGLNSIVEKDKPDICACAEEMDKAFTLAKIAQVPFIHHFLYSIKTIFIII